MLGTDSSEATFACAAKPQKALLTSAAINFLRMIICSSICKFDLGIMTVYCLKYPPVRRYF